MSETPRTDAAVMRQELDTMPSEFEYVDADFSRQLERELTAALQDKRDMAEVLGELADAKAELQAANDRAARLEREMADATRDKERLDWLEANAKGSFNFGHSLTNMAPLNRWGIDKASSYDAAMRDDKKGVGL